MASSDTSVGKILSRLAALEADQASLSTTVASERSAAVAAARERLMTAEAARAAAEARAASAATAAATAAATSAAAAAAVPPPVLMQLNMEGIEAATAAAARAAERSRALRLQAEALASASVAQAAAITSAPAATLPRSLIADTSSSTPPALPAPPAMRAITPAGWEGNDEGDVLVKTVTVALDDVERAMRLSPLVGKARAFGYPDVKYGYEVYCVVAVAPGVAAVNVSEPALMMHAQRRLPNAMVPRRIFVVDGAWKDEELSRATLAEEGGLARLLKQYGATPAGGGEAAGPSA